MIPALLIPRSWLKVGSIGFENDWKLYAARAGAEASKATAAAARTTRVARDPGAASRGKNLRCIALVLLLLRESVVRSRAREGPVGGRSGAAVHPRGSHGNP